MYISEREKLEMEQNAQKRWGEWVFVESNNTLISKNDMHPNYEIDLDQCNTPKEILQWIMHIHHKTWATDETVMNLIRAFDHLFEDLYI